MTEPPRAASRFPGRFVFPPATLPLLISLLTGACGIIDSPQDPDEILPVRQLNPRRPVTEIAFSAPPDSLGGTGPFVLRWNLTVKARNALEASGVLDIAARAAPGTATAIEALVPGTEQWTELTSDTGSGPDSLDLWWLDAWDDPAAGATLVDTDGRIRLRLPAHAGPGRARVRVLETAPAVWTRTAPGRTLTAWDNYLLLMGGGAIRRWSAQGGELQVLGAAGAPPSYCRSAERFFGVTETEILVLAGTGGTWNRAASLPWTDHGGVAIATDGSDLYLIRHVLTGETLPKLYRLSETLLLQTHSFAGAVTDSTTLRRNGLQGGTGPGLAWWPDRRVLAAPGTQADQFGLVTFTRAGRLREFIPLPFDPGPVQIAFLDDYLFIARARPTLEALGWSDTFTPALPEAVLLWRWPDP